MAHKLKDLVITKVALVDEGSCSAAHIKLYKRKEGGDGAMSKTLQDILKNLSEDDQKVVNDELAKVKAELPEGALSAEDKAKLEEDKKKAELEKQAAFDDLENMKKAKDGGTTDEELLKNVDPAVRAYIEKANAKAAAAEAAILKMKEDSDNAEALAKAKELPNLGAKEEDLAKSFKVLKNKDGQLFTDIFGILKAANNMIADGGNLSEIGKSAGNAGAGSGDNGSNVDLNKAADLAWVEIEKAADIIKQKDSCSKEQAISKAITQNPELYQKYINAME